MDPLLILSGFLVGVLVGMTGMGGAAIMTPLLILFFGVAPVTAVGTDIFAQAITKTVGGWRHLRLRTVNLGLAFWLAAGSVPGAVGGVLMIDLIRAHYGQAVNDVILIALATVLVLVGISVIVKAIRGPLSHRYDRDSERPEFKPDGWHKLLTMLLGVAMGFTIGLTSVGSGILIALLLITVYRLAPRRVVGTDIFHAAILMWAAAVIHALIGNVNYSMMLALLIGSVPGILIGSNLSVKVSEQFLRSALGVIMLTSSLGILQKVGAPVPSWAIIAFPVALAVGLIAQHYAWRRRPSTLQMPPSGEQIAAER